MRCAVASTLTIATAALFNGPLNEAIEPVASAGRDLSTLFSATLLVVLALVARHCPRVISPRWMGLASVALLLVGHAMGGAGVAMGSAALVSVGMCLSSAAETWCGVVWLLACSRMDVRRICICLACASCAGFVLAWVVSLSHSFAVASGVDCLATLMTLWLAQPLAQPLFSRLVELGSPADRAISQPSTTLSFGHPLFASILVFSLALGYGLRYRSADAQSLSDTFAVLLMAAIALSMIVRRVTSRIDVVFMLSFGLVVSGFLGVLIDDVRVAGVSSALLLGGYLCFCLLKWLALCAVAARGTVDALPVIAWGTAANYLGIVVGAQLGALNAAMAGDRLAAKLTVACVLGLIVMYTTWSARRFSFDETINGIEPTTAPVEVRVVDGIEERCGKLAAFYGLTPREREVFVLLAHGYNASRITEELVISRNTVKYHARSIYAKLGIHNQQELIDLALGA